MPEPVSHNSDLFIEWRLRIVELLSVAARILIAGKVDQPLEEKLFADKGSEELTQIGDPSIQRRLLGVLGFVNDPQRRKEWFTCWSYGQGEYGSMKPKSIKDGLPWNFGPKNSILFFW